MQQLKWEHVFIQVHLSVVSALASQQKDTGLILFFFFVLPILTVQRLPRPVRDYTAPPISMESITF